MHLHSYRLRNFRRLRDVHVELAANISIFVGANNSGKTSATQAMQMFLSGGKDAFSLYDFSSHVCLAGCYGLLANERSRSQRPSFLLSRSTFGSRLKRKIFISLSPSCLRPLGPERSLASA
ncbi:hypothetical protein D3877_08565 [Azospirillum cavernae]|uniref:Endonuclease GajA/Old nuclease/RecF-like AAA domain-containing protein n=1 Tax=Azospirillum cavernae TaxID=2320860 RepID=A0A418W3F6_9PROT|nr:hypothetical protein D3877_08565 [Azospirillum cavernae]